MYAGWQDRTRSLWRAYKCALRDLNRAVFPDPDRTQTEFA